MLLKEKRQKNLEWKTVLWLFPTFQNLLLLTNLNRDSFVIQGIQQNFLTILLDFKPFFNFCLSLFLFVNILKYM